MAKGTSTMKSGIKATDIWCTPQLLNLIDQFQTTINNDVNCEQHNVDSFTKHRQKQMC
jgi:hypothetical protein